jgi:hypothetical protein
MGTKNYKIVRNFLNEEEKSKVIKLVDAINYESFINNHHIEYLTSKINGSSNLFDITSTEVTRELTSFQSGGNRRTDLLDPLFIEIANRISDVIDLPKDNMFLQIVDMNKGGTIKPHYDVGYDGYINYKCNISVLSENYSLFVEKEELKLSEGDLYCFEASLYKHWTKDEFTKRRILLSYGFGVPYAHLGRDYNDPRVRMSRRIQKYIYNKK